MTLDEARLIGKLISHADGGCSHCVRDLAERANAMFPQFVWIVARTMRREQPDSEDNYDWVTPITVNERSNP